MRDISNQKAKALILSAYSIHSCRIFNQRRHNENTRGSQGDESRTKRKIRI